MITRAATRVVTVYQNKGMLTPDCSLNSSQMRAWIYCTCVENMNASHCVFIDFGMLKVLQWRFHSPFFVCPCRDVLQNSQLLKVTNEDENKDTAYDQGLDSSQQARVAQSLQAHDYVRLSQSFSDRRLARIKNKLSNKDPLNSCPSGGNNGDDPRASLCQ